MRIPGASYRIQFGPDFSFSRARETVAYLSTLGITDLYASPIFKSKKGSSHGYDVVDPTALNPDLGSVDDFSSLMEELKAANMGWIQDIVPNHMAFDGENRMLMDVLENGRYSEYFPFFDIQWEHFYGSLSERVLTPFLGKHYSESLDAREISLRYDRAGFLITYYSLTLPLKIESYVTIMTHRLSKLRSTLGAEDPDLIKFLGVLYSLKNLPVMEKERRDRYSQIQFIKRILWELYSKNEEVRKFLDENIDIFNGKEDSEDALMLLDSLLSEQLFRLSFWKVASEELNYRRFFNINGLICLKMEDEGVFEDTHSLILELVRERKIQGLRIDHIDGLYDPTGYLRKLRDHAGDIYLAVEKILELNEELPSLWAVQGTTGYDFMNYLNGIYCREKNGRRFNRLYYTFTKFRTSYETLLYEKKKLLIEKDMTGDVDNLAHLLKLISSRDRYGIDITLYGLKRTIVEILALFPVYRTYIRHDHYSDADRRTVTETMKRARDMNPALVHELDFIERYLLLQFGEQQSEEDRREWIHFVMRFQQLTGPLMAKGFEDTTLYVYNRLLSLNDVGGDPSKFGISETEFHEFNVRRSRHQPHSMNATATHDTKRGEDVRARINVLSEIPDLWDAHLKKWSKANRKKKKTRKGVMIPERNDEYFLYQTLVGAWPFHENDLESFRNRLKEYVIKAVREAKVHTAWLKPDTDYEEHYLAFIDGILTDSDDNDFLKDFITFQKFVSFYGIFNSLSQTLVKITAPGVPDFYQGTELWDLTLVDPDNRRPVDFKKRMEFLSQIGEHDGDQVNMIHSMLSAPEDGRLKLFLIYRALAARNSHRSLFEKGTYIPLGTEGKFKDSVIAFAVEYGPHRAITVAPRFLTEVVGENTIPCGRDVWDDTHIVMPVNSQVSWRDTISGTSLEGGETLYVGDAFGHFPAALLMAPGGNS